MPNRCLQEKEGTGLTSNRSNMADAHDLENVWTIAYLGNGMSKKDEYLIINRGTGLHMTCGGYCT